MANDKKKPDASVQKTDVKGSAKEKGGAAKKAKKAKSAEKKPNIFVRMGRAIKRFVKGFFSEGKKIIWTDGKTVLKNTGVVLGVIVFIGVFVWLFDFAVESLMTYSVSFSPRLQTEQVTEGETEEHTEAQTEAQSEAGTEAATQGEDASAAAGMMNLLDGFIID